MIEEVKLTPKEVEQALGHKGLTLKELEDTQYISEKLISKLRDKGWKTPSEVKELIQDEHNQHVDDIPKEEHELLIALAEKKAREEVMHKLDKYKVRTNLSYGTITYLVPMPYLEALKEGRLEGEAMVTEQQERLQEAFESLAHNTGLSRNELKQAMENSRDPEGNPYIGVIASQEEQEPSNCLDIGVPLHYIKRLAKQGWRKVILEGE